MEKFRKEKDTMGEVLIPENVYYGAQTKRASENFQVSKITFQDTFIKTLGILKLCAAKVNNQLGILPIEISEAIQKAAEEVIDGAHNDQFIVDIFQTGSGTSTNMNMNEVISSRANEILTSKKGGKSPVHPNDHVNLCQSSNDVIPSTINICSSMLVKDRLIPSLENLKDELSKKAIGFKDIRKIGRTHLQDAVEMSLGEEFSGYARQIELGIERLKGVEKNLSELALGGTAIGNGLNAHKDFAGKTIGMISKICRVELVEAKNHFAAQASQDSSLALSGTLKTTAVSLAKIANDIRWLSSGPRCGLGEINIPALQPGSSIMPGKVNPVIPESVIQVAAQIAGNDSTITFGAMGGNFELNVMLPVIAYNLIQSIDLLTSASNILSNKCIKGITANSEKCASYIEKSLSLATYLIPKIGYDGAAEIAKKAYEKGVTIRKMAKELKVLPEDEIDDLLP
jgi:fumarate hydratase class II